MALDLASKLDIAALAILVELDEGFGLFFRCYVPEARVEEEENSQYYGWAEDGDLIATAWSGYRLQLD